MLKTPSLLLPAWDTTLCILELRTEQGGSDRGFSSMCLSVGTKLSNYMELGRNSLQVADGHREERLKLAINEDGGTRQEDPRRVFCAFGRLSL